MDFKTNQGKLLTNQGKLLTKQLSTLICGSLRATLANRSQCLENIFLSQYFLSQYCASKCLVWIRPKIDFFSDVEVGNNWFDYHVDDVEKQNNNGEDEEIAAQASTPSENTRSGEVTKFGNFLKKSSGIKCKK